MTVSTNVGSVFAMGAQRLRAGAGPHGVASASLDAGLLLAHVLQTTRAGLMSHTEREVCSAVLVPRPETELLVERALALRSASYGRVADLGTGCGAVALALASERPHWQVTATDLSAEALAIARANAAQLKLHAVDFRHGSWFAPLAETRFDLIVSNPPYVAADDPALAAPGLAHEPRLALTPGTDALACLRAIARDAPQHLDPGGWLLLEHGNDQGEAVRRELVLAGLRYVRSHRDLAGHERVTEGQI